MEKPKNKAKPLKLGKNDINCPGCNAILNISQELINDKLIQCPKCEIAIKNPLFVDKSDNFNIENYSDINDALKKVIDKPGFLIISVNDYYIQFNSSLDSNVLICEAVSQYYLPSIGNLTTEFEKLSFKIEPTSNYSKYYKLDKTTSSRIILELKKIFEEIYKIHFINYQIELVLDDISVQTTPKNESTKSQQKEVYNENTNMRKDSIRGEKKIKSLINTERTHCENEEQIYFLCPICGVNLSVPVKYMIHDELKCYSCHGTFKSPIFHPNDKTIYKKTNFQQKSNYFSYSQSKKHVPTVGQIITGLLVVLIIWAFIKGCTQTPEESMRQYQEEQKIIREYEKKNKETEEYFEFMGGQE